MICLLYYFPHRTGLTIYVQRIAEELVRRGHEVTVLCARHDKSVPRDETVYNGVRIIRLWPLPFAISRGMLLPAYPWAAWLLMRTQDVVQVNVPLFETAILALLSKLTGRPVIATHHGDLILPKGLSNRLIQGTMFLMYKLLAKRAAHIVAYSQDYADHSYYARPFLDKVSVIYPPIHMPLPDPQKAAELRAQWSHEGGPIIGYSGRFVEEKRPDLLIRSLDVINQKYPNARIVFAGEYNIPYEGTWRREQALVERYKDQLIFLGNLTDMQAMADFYAACDVLALTSDSECFALVQVEAMLCGTPVVMTDTPGGRVPVRETGMGLLAQPGSAESIGETIVKVLDDPDRYQRPRDEIAEIFSFQATVDHYEQLFRQVARRRDGR